MKTRRPASPTLARDPITDQPQPGYYTRTLVPGGPRVPARIWRPCHCTVNGGDDNRQHDWSETCDRFPPLACDVDGRAVDPAEAWTWLAKNPISRREYEFMAADAEWCRRHAPGDPKANPRQRVDWNTLNFSF